MLVFEYFFKYQIRWCVHISKSNSAIAERPRYRVGIIMAKSGRLQGTGTGRQYLTNIAGRSSTTMT